MKSNTWHFPTWLLRSWLILKRLHAHAGCRREGGRIHAARTIELERGRVARLDEPFCTRRLLVLQGTVWLTGTPAEGDVLLREGEEFLLAGDGVYIAEALAAATMVLQ